MPNNLATAIYWHRMDGLCVGNEGKQKQTVFAIITSYNFSMSQVPLHNINDLPSPSKLQSAWILHAISISQVDGFSIDHKFTSIHLQNFQSFQVKSGQRF